VNGHIDGERAGGLATASRPPQERRKVMPDAYAILTEEMPDEMRILVEVYSQLP